MLEIRDTSMRRANFNGNFTNYVDWIFYDFPRIMLIRDDKCVLTMWDLAVSLN